MVPALRSGDVVSINNADLADILPGAIVVFARNGHFVAHRVVRWTRDEQGVKVETRGDAQPQGDPPLDASELLGVVTAVHRRGVEHSLRRRPHALSRAIAWTVGRSRLALRLWNRLHLAFVDRSLPVRTTPAAILRGHA